MNLHIINIYRRFAVKTLERFMKYAYTDFETFSAYGLLYIQNAFKSST